MPTFATHLGPSRETEPGVRVNWVLSSYSSSVVSIMPPFQVAHI